MSETRIDETERRKRALDFYMGIVIALFSSLFVSCFIQLTNNIWTLNRNYVFIIDWAIMLILTSTAFLQFTKFGMKRVIGSDPRLKFFDVGTILFDLFWVLVIALAWFSKI